MNNQREGEDFFYGVYRASNEGVLAKIRRETYGEDLGQFSWITADELKYSNPTATADGKIEQAFK